MAVNVHELATVKLKKWFYDIRVDHLNGDELDFELEIRNIVFDNNESISRKRRALRETIKDERLVENPEKSLKRNPLEDFNDCIGKFTELEEIIQISTKGVPKRCQSRLLHLGNRLILLEEHLSPEERVEVSRMKNEVLSLLNSYFYGKRSLHTGDLEDTGMERLFNEEGYQSHQIPGMGTLSTGIQPKKTWLVDQTDAECLSEDDKDTIDSLLRLGLLEKEKIPIWERRRLGMRRSHWNRKFILFVGTRI